MKSLLDGLIALKTFLLIVSPYIAIGGIVLVLIAGTFGIALSILQGILESLCSLYEKVSGKPTPLPILKFISRIDKITTDMLDKYESIK
jgi:hypothetical protein